MNTQNNELRTIATLMSKNLTSTILLLQKLGYDFNKTIDEQPQEVDEKLSQMILNVLTSDASESVIEVTEEQPQQVKEEEPQQEVQTTETPIEAPVDKVLIGYEKLKLDFENEKNNKINYLKNEIINQKINIKKYKRDEAPTKRTRLINEILFFSEMRFFGIKKYVKKYIENNSIYKQRLQDFNINNYKEEVTELVNNYFEAEIKDKEIILNDLIKIFNEIMSSNFEII